MSNKHIILLKDCIRNDSELNKKIYYTTKKFNIVMNYYNQKVLYRD